VQTYEFLVYESLSDPNYFTHQPVAV
jgi:hypothetical protein